MSHPLDSTIGAAWDGRVGAFWVRERRALCELAYLDPSLADRAWKDLPPQTREKLLLGVRAAIELGSECSRMLLAQVRA